MLDIRRSHGDGEERVLRVMKPIREYGGEDAMARASTVRADLRIPPLHLLRFVPPIDGN